MDNTNKKIMLIEDEFFIRDLYERYLTKSGYQVITAIDGQDGLEKALANKVDLILLDIMMPKLTGIEVLEKIKTEGSIAKDTPVYLLTNQVQESIIKEAFKLGAEGYLIKAQLLPKQIVEEIENIFKNKKQ
jgi:two-component system, OmpR family, alkaline phosphatase synthesis response regulator PhoP